MVLTVEVIEANAAMLRQGNGMFKHTRYLRVAAVAAHNGAHVAFSAASRPVVPFATALC